ncbi:hypothetical protein FPRO04_13209 [Fusarium proliferatum]|nr:hypothetical protein FPRO04_13209 [Fusarium proliferatum]
MDTIKFCRFSFKLNKGLNSLEGVAYVFDDGKIVCPPQPSPVITWLAFWNFWPFAPGENNKIQSKFVKGFEISLDFDKPRQSKKQMDCRLIDTCILAELSVRSPTQDTEPQIGKTEDETSKGTILSSGTRLSATFNSNDLVEESVPVLSFPYRLKPNDSPVEPLEGTESFTHPEVISICPGIYSASGSLTKMAKNIRVQILDQIPKQVPNTTLFEFQWTNDQSELAKQLFEHLIQQGTLPSRPYKMAIAMYQQKCGHVTVPPGQVSIILPCVLMPEDSTVSMSFLNNKAEVKKWSNKEVFILNEDDWLSTCNDLYYLAIHISI